MRQPLSGCHHLFGTMIDYDLAIAAGVTPAAVHQYRKRHPELPRSTRMDRRAKQAAEMLRAGPMHIVDMMKVMGSTWKTVTAALKAAGAVRVRCGVWSLPDVPPPAP